MTDHFLKKIFAPLVPYLTIGIGLLVFRNAWVSIFSYHIGMIAVVFFSRERIPLKQLVLGARHKVPVFTALLGAAGGLLLYLLWPLLSVPTDIDVYLRDIGLRQEIWPAFLAYFILVNPWIEEYYWRGHLGSDSKRVVLNDLFFSGYHILVMAGKMELIWLAVVFVMLVFGAWFWRQSNRLGKGLLPSVASHLSADITIIFTIYCMTMR